MAAGRRLPLVACLVASVVVGCSDDDPSTSQVAGTSTASSTTPSHGVGGAGGTGGEGLGTQGGGGTATGGGGGAGGGCSSGAGGEGGAVDPNDPCASLVGPRVVWVTEADPHLTITEPVELLWGFQFVVAIPDHDRASYVLEHERCATPAGEAKTCDTATLPLNEAACEVRFAPKYGVDPSQYAEGDNEYSFALRLKKGCDVVSSDAFTTVLKYAP